MIVPCLRRPVSLRPARHGPGARLVTDVARYPGLLGGRLGDGKMLNWAGKNDVIARRPQADVVTEGNACGAFP